MTTTSKITRKVYTIIIAVIVSITLSACGGGGDSFVTSVNGGSDPYQFTSAPCAPGTESWCK